MLDGKYQGVIYQSTEDGDTTTFYINYSPKEDYKTFKLEVPIRSQDCWIRIDSSSGSSPQWTYSGTLMYKSGTGYGKWTAGATGLPVFNSYEENTSAVWNNGIDPTQTIITDNTVDLVPLVSTVIYPARITQDGTGGLEYWVSEPNGISESCGTEDSNEDSDEG
jgi:hypothetical protein